MIHNKAVSVVCRQCIPTAICMNEHKEKRECAPDNVFQGAHSLVEVVLKTAASVLEGQRLYN